MQCFTSRQHSIGYMGDGFYGSKDPTNSNKVLKGSRTSSEAVPVVTRCRCIVFDEYSLTGVCFCMVLIVVCGGQVASNEPYASEASSDAVSLSVSKGLSHTAQKSANDEKKFTDISVKVEPDEAGVNSCPAITESEVSTSCVKVKSENTDETGGLTAKDVDPGDEKTEELTAKRQSASASVVSDAVETSQPPDSPVSLSASLSAACQQESPQPANEAEKLCSETIVSSLLENDCRDASVGNVDDGQQSGDSSVVNTAPSEAPHRLVGCEESCDDTVVSVNTNLEEEDQSIGSKTDMAAATHSRQKSKKLAAKHGKSPPGSPGLLDISCFYCRDKYGVRYIL